MKLKQIIAGALFAVLPLTALANTGNIQLDQAPVNLNNKASLQRGAQVFTNYCLSCHSANYMRYNRLQDIGLSEKQIKENLMLAGEKVGETMKIAMSQKDAKQWFGATPPDLTVIARARGADWLYTYLRGFYKDETRPTGWNNTVFDKVGMPHVLWEYQGTQVLKHEKVKDAKGHEHEVSKLVLETAGTKSPAEFNQMAGDLTNYLVYMGEPAKLERYRIGVFVLAFLAVLFVFAYFLKKEYWKDIH